MSYLSYSDIQRFKDQVSDSDSIIAEASYSGMHESALSQDEVLSQDELDALLMGGSEAPSAGGLSDLALEKESLFAETETEVFRGGVVDEDTRDVFLSHSSRDIGDLPGVIQFFKTFGVTVYIDKNDKELPNKTTMNTGRRLKEMIDLCKKFILFVSPNSKDSKWIPWELGIADIKKSIENVALLPVVDYDASWPEQEYLGLYRRIIRGRFKGKTQEEWAVFNHHENTAVPLAKWLKE